MRFWKEKINDRLFLLNIQYYELVVFGRKLSKDHVVFALVDWFTVRVIQDFMCHCKPLTCVCFGACVSNHFPLGVQGHLWVSLGWVGAVCPGLPLLPGHQSSCPETDTISFYWMHRTGQRGTQAHTHTHICTHARTHAPTHMYTQAHAHTHAHAHTSTRTHPVT